jgi:hypothetical protein
MRDGIFCRQGTQVVLKKSSTIRRFSDRLRNSMASRLESYSVKLIRGSGASCMTAANGDEFDGVADIEGDEGGGGAGSSRCGGTTLGEAMLAGGGHVRLFESAMFGLLVEGGGGGADNG